MQSPDASPTDTPYIIEQSKRFSESFLWSRQRSFYSDQGVMAWNQNHVPFHITTNPGIARAYARVVVAWIQDLIAASERAGKKGSTILDRDEPLYIVELGSGHGRFGYYFLRQLTLALADAGLADMRIIYVMTDMVERNVRFWQAHPQLQSYIQAGHLDFARFDGEHPGPLELMVSGKTLTPDTTRNPVAFLANYIFDSIRQDLFSVEKGDFKETKVTISSTQPDDDLNDPDLLGHTRIAFEQYPATTDYYEDPDFNRILEEYRQQLPNIGFIFPVASLECLRYFSELTHGRMLVLSSDKGFDREDAILWQGGPGLGVHGGAISFMVNFHALGRYIENKGGEFLRSLHRKANLTTAGFALGLRRDEMPRTTHTFDELVVNFGPDHIFSVSGAVRENLKALDLDVINAWMRLCNWDPLMLFYAIPFIIDLLPKASPLERSDIYDVVQRTWEEYYYIGESPNGANLVAVLLRAMGCANEALTYLQRSLEMTGPRAATFTEMGMCLFDLQQRDAARQCAEKALELDPSEGEARALIIRLAADQSREIPGVPSPSAPQEPSVAVVREQIAQEQIA